MSNDAAVLMDALEQLAQSGIPGNVAAPLVDIGTKDYLEFFQQEFIQDNVFQGNSICRFFEGPYGAGKTHLLSLLAQLGMRNGFAVVRIDLSQALSLTDWDQITKFVLENMQYNTPTGAVKGLPNILKLLGENPQTKPDHLHDHRLPHPGFARAMHYAVGMRHKSSQYQQILSQFLSGSKVLVSELRRMNLIGIKGSLSKRNADQVLKTALNGLHLLGVPTMLLLDENERTLSRGTAAAQNKHSTAANLMRRLIDAAASGGIKGSVIVFTLLPNFIEMCANSYPALGQRLRTVPPDDAKASWRSTVLSVEDISSAGHPDAFAGLAVKRFTQIYHELSKSEKSLNVKGVETELANVAAEVMRRSAGAGYRRELMKALASKVLRRIED